jgi:hypothetical protein
MPIRLDPRVAREWNRKVTSQASIAPKVRASGNVGVRARDIQDLSNNLVIFSEYISISGARLLGNIAIDLLSKTQPKVPWDTGQLRESGTAYVVYGGRSAQVVGRGTRDGGVKANLSRVTGRVPKGVHFLTANVTYRRFGDGGRDIAVWTHEDLLPYEARPAKPAARKPGTGPKYLESTWYENRDHYLGWIQDTFSQDSISRDIQKMLSVTRTAKGKFEVDTVKLRRVF